MQHTSSTASEWINWSSIAVHSVERYLIYNCAIKYNYLDYYKLSSKLVSSVRYFKSLRGVMSLIWLYYKFILRLLSWWSDSKMLKKETSLIWLWLHHIFVNYCRFNFILLSACKPPIPLKGEMSSIWLNLWHFMNTKIYFKDISKLMGCCLMHNLTMLTKSLLVILLGFLSLITKFLFFWKERMNLLADSITFLRASFYSTLTSPNSLSISSINTSILVLAYWKSSNCLIAYSLNPLMLDRMDKSPFIFDNTSRSFVTMQCTTSCNLYVSKKFIRKWLRIDIINTSWLNPWTRSVGTRSWWLCSGSSSPTYR